MTKLLDPETGRGLKIPREKKKLYNLVHRLREDGYIVDKKTKTVYYYPDQSKNTDRLKAIKTEFKFKLKKYPFRQVQLNFYNK
jgi:hypothetical protein